MAIEMLEITRPDGTSEYVVPTIIDRISDVRPTHGMADGTKSVVYLECGEQIPCTIRADELVEIYRELMEG